MQLGILSDTHDQFARTERAIAVLAAEGATAFAHCGDLMEPDMLWLFEDKTLYFCFGNNDHEPQAAKAMAATIGATCLGDGGTFQFGNRTVALTHGHHGATRSRLLKEQPDYLLVGHSHQKGFWREGSTLVINPGALHRVAVFTVALLDVATGHVRYLTIER